jgi:ketosteroid isomerase-like protein
MRFSAIVAGVLASLIAAGSCASAATASHEEAEIRALLDRWAKAFHDRNIDGVMAIYARGERLVAYDIVAPLEFVGSSAYRKDYEAFFAQYEGPIDIEYRDLVIVADKHIGFAHGLERMSGTLTSGQRSDMWIRFTECYRRLGHRWYAVHDHVSVPVDLASGKAMTSLKPVM